MTKLITAEEPFSVLANYFAISPSKESYTLQYSSNGTDYTPWGEATKAGENTIVTNCPESIYFILKGNKSVVTLTY